MEYLWLKTYNKKYIAAIDQFKEVCLARDGRLPLLNLPEQPEECDGCLVAVADKLEIRGILTCLYSRDKVEVCILVHPEFRQRGIGTELLHRLLLSTEKTIAFPVAADDKKAMAFLDYIGRKEICRERLMTLTRENYSDVSLAEMPGRKNRLRVACRLKRLPQKDVDDISEGKQRYILYYDAVPIGHCLVTEGCISDMWIQYAVRKRGYGSFLLRTVIRHQFQSGRKKLILHVTNRNRAACALYRKFGFAVTDEIVYYV